MNKKAMKIRFSLQLFSVLALAGFYPLAQAQVDNLTVQLSLDADQIKLNPTTHGSCGNNNHPGCINIPADNKARIHFVLTGNRQCNRPRGQTWNLSEVYLGGKNSAGKPGSWGDLDAEIEADFNVANSRSGLLNPEPSSNEQQIVIFDGNNYAYDVWYKVVATCVDQGGVAIATIETDPRLENGGVR